MSIQVVHNQPNFYGIGISLIKHLLDLLRPVLSGATFGHSHMPLASQRFYFHKISTTPFLTYSSSIRFGCPGLHGIGVWTSPINCLLDSSIHTTG